MESEMSSDFLEDVECNGAAVLLTMRASGFCELTIFEKDELNEIDEVIKDGQLASFPLLPNKLGIENAEKIAKALKSWIEHIKLVGLIQN
jgi:hypothetical protein